MTIANQYIFSFFTTIILEFVIYCFLIKKDKSTLFLYSVLINSFTLPIVDYVYLKIWHNFLFLELFVFIVESFLIAWLIKIKYSKAILLSACANIFTAGIGFLYYSFFY